MKSSNRKRKEEEKKKKKKLEKPRCFALKLEHGPRGLRRKPLKPGALTNWSGSTDLMLATWVDGWSLASCRCWILEIIRSPG